jgi:predicted phosphoribosyltransferase
VDAQDGCEEPVVLVDDGLATGVTATAALRVLWEQRPREIVSPLDVRAGGRGVASRRGRRGGVRGRSTGFTAVGGSYTDFGQVSDAEVTALLAGAGPF